MNFRETKYTSFTSYLYPNNSRNTRSLYETIPQISDGLKKEFTPFRTVPE